MHARLALHRPRDQADFDQVERSQFAQPVGRARLPLTAEERTELMSQRY